MTRAVPYHSSTPSRRTPRATDRRSSDTTAGTRNVGDPPSSYSSPASRCVTRIAGTSSNRCPIRMVNRPTACNALAATNKPANGMPTRTNAPNGCGDGAYGETKAASKSPATAHRALPGCPNRTRAAGWRLMRRRPRHRQATRATHGRHEPRAEEKGRKDCRHPRAPRTNEYVDCSAVSPSRGRLANKSSPLHLGTSRQRSPVNVASMSTRCDPIAIERLMAHRSPRRRS